MLVKFTLLHQLHKLDLKQMSSVRENDRWLGPACVFRLLVLAIFLLFGMIGCRQNEQKEQLYDRFSVATLPWPGSTPFYVGIEKGFFRDEGLEVTLKPVATGLIGLEAVLAGKAEAAAVADTPIARAAVNDAPIAVIATIAEIQRAIMIIAQQGNGITGPGDLEGRAIGVTKGAGAEFFLNIYLLSNDILPSEVRIINIAPENIVEALLHGEVDAVSTWSPYKLMLLEELGKEAVILTDLALYLQTLNVVTTQEFSRNNGERIAKFIRGLERANEFIRRNPGESLSIMAKNLGTESVLYRKEWADYSFVAQLHQSLLLNLEDQARWMIGQDAESQRETPDFMKFIDAAPLKVVAPEAVDIIGK